MCQLHNCKRSSNIYNNIHTIIKNRQPGECLVTASDCFVSLQSPVNLPHPVLYTGHFLIGPSFLLKHRQQPQYLISQKIPHLLTIRERKLLAYTSLNGDQVKCISTNTSTNVYNYNYNHALHKAKKTIQYFWKKWYLITNIHHRHHIYNLQDSHSFASNEGYCTFPRQVISRQDFSQQYFSPTCVIRQGLAKHFNHWLITLRTIAEIMVEI